MTVRPVKCVECGITWPSHPDYLNHLAAIERHRELARPVSSDYADLRALAAKWAATPMSEQIGSRILALLADLDAERTKNKDVLFLHELTRSSDGTCLGCGRKAPCPTRNAALGPEVTDD